MRSRLLRRDARQGAPNSTRKAARSRTSLYSLGDQPSGRAGAAQFPERRCARCRGAAQGSIEPDEVDGLHRSRHHRHPARPRARRAALLRLPPASRHVRAEDLRGTDRRSGVAEGARARSTATSSRSTCWSARWRRASRPQRHAAGLRLLRHRVPHLHPAGFAPAEERPLLHARISARRSTRRPASPGCGTTISAACWSGMCPTWRRISPTCATSSSPGARARRDDAAGIRIPGLVDLMRIDDPAMIAAASSRMPGSTAISPAAGR